MTTPKLTRLEATVAVRRCRFDVAHRYALVMPPDLRPIAGALLHQLLFDLERAEAKLHTYVMMEGTHKPEQGEDLHADT